MRSMGADMEKTGATAPPTGLDTFTTVSKLFHDIYSGSGHDILRLGGVTADDLALIDNKQTSRRRCRIRIKRYYAKDGLLLITIPTGFHEISHVNLYGVIIAKLARMDLDDQWTSSGATKHETAAGDMGGADSTGRPRFTRRGPDSWPTLVIESGVSDSLQALRDDMRWWFSASDHHVKIVILVKLDVTERHIILEKYLGIQSGAAEERPGATMTRAATARQLEPVLDQTIHITQTTGDPMDDTSYIVTGGVLRLEFGLLFLREPVPEGREHDVIIEMPDLQTLAAKIWGLSRQQVRETVDYKRRLPNREPLATR